LNKEGLPFVVPIVKSGRRRGCTWLRQGNILVGWQAGVYITFSLTKRYINLNANAFSKLATKIRNASDAIASLVAPKFNFAAIA